MEISNFTQQRIDPNSVLPRNTGGTTPVVNDDSQAIKTTAPTADTLSITSSKSIVVQQVVTQQISIALQINSPSTGRPEHSHKDRHDDEGNHFGKIADKIHHKIKQEREANVENVSDENKHTAAVNSVRLKVEQGFEQATTIINKMGIMDQTAADDIAQTQSDVDQVIDQEAQAPIVESTSLNAVNAKRELSTELQLTTNDGDIITIDMSRSQEMFAGSLQNGTGTQLSASATFASQLNISVEGDLSKKESKSIQQIIKRVSKLAEKLFEGNTGAAMGKLGALKIDSKQLASMSLNMSSSMSYAAVSAYSEVSRLPVDGDAAALTSAPIDTPTASPTPETTVAAPEVPLDQPATITSSELADEAADIVDETVETTTLENPFAELRNIFSGIADMFASVNEQITSEHKSFIKDFFNDVVDAQEETTTVSDDHEADLMDAA